MCCKQKLLKTLSRTLIFDILLLSPTMLLENNPNLFCETFRESRHRGLLVLFYISKMGRVTKRLCVECKGDASVPCFLRGSKYRHQTVTLQAGP